MTIILRWKSLLPLLLVANLGAQDDRKPEIRPEGEWGVPIERVKKVFDAATAEIWKYFPDRRLRPIKVEPKGGPITLYRRSPKGEYIVKLATEGSRWSQYTFQWAHELGHILCNYEEEAHNNKWFEESLCEVASLFVLRRSAVTWKKTPPFPEGKDYAKSLHAYAEDRIRKAPLKARSLAAWYEENADALSKNATDRPKNNIVAGQLLPLFEKEPKRWAAVTWLNTEKLTPSHSFQDYLQAWHGNTPREHRPFIRKIATMLGIKLAK